MPAEKLDNNRKVNIISVPEKDKTFVFPYNPFFADIYVEDVKASLAKPAAEIITERNNNPVQERFSQMRHLSSEICRDALSTERFRESIFYRQAQFMADFEDDYQKSVHFSMYYPYYQMMTYEQLRTYFTWRSKFRTGNIQQTDLSCVFLYIYELINNIGVSSSGEGIEKLLLIWNSYRKFADVIDKYMALWLRDYFILNQCPFSFAELVRREPLLQNVYSGNSDKYTLEFYDGLSAYKITQSIFYTQGYDRVVKECFNHVIKKLNVLTDRSGLKFNDLIFDKSTDNRWQPFANAIFYMKPEYLPKDERTVKISDECEFTCRNGKWTYTDTVNINLNGKFLLAYIFKRMEQLLRKAYKFKYKLNIDDKKVDKQRLDNLLPGTGCSGLFREIDTAVKEYYIDSKRTVVRVDESNLIKIRENALITQEKLTVSDDSSGEVNADISEKEPCYYEVQVQKNAVLMPDVFNNIGPESDITESERTDIWSNFACSLEPAEETALNNILNGMALKSMYEYARIQGVMLEVLLDGINQKALGYIGDNLLELSDEITVYDEYIKPLRKAVGCE